MKGKDGARRRQIRELLSKGVSRRQIATKIGGSLSFVHMVAIELKRGIEPSEDALDLPLDKCRRISEFPPLVGAKAEVVKRELAFQLEQMLARQEIAWTSSLSPDKMLNQVAKVRRGLAELDIELRRLS